MANYEELYKAVQPGEKGLKDSAAAAVRLQKTLAKNTEEGNLAEARKTLASLSDTIRDLQDSVDAVSAELDGFDVQAYFASGEFTEQLLASCGEKGVDAKGEKGVYEMFPFKVRILGDAEHQGEVYIGRKKQNTCRPSHVAETLRKSIAKLYDANFKVESFMNELAEAYETSCLKSNTHLGSNQALSKIYKCLAPTARARKEYDMQAFAFDLERLFEAGREKWVAKNGRRYDFGTGREGSSSIRVLSSTGVEFFINTLRQMGDAGE